MVGLNSRQFVRKTDLKRWQLMVVRWLFVVEILTMIGHVNGWFLVDKGCGLL